MSGRWLTILAVTGCLLLVAFALWQRSRTTRQVREFWGASQAHLIQHGTTVRMRSVEQNSEWHDISSAPGLVHLRATLVDDRYYQWNSAMNTKLTQPSIQRYEFQFAQAQQQVELTIAPDSGLVTNAATGKSVPLIPASQRAVAEYLKEIHTDQ